MGKVILKDFLKLMRPYDKIYIESYGTDIAIIPIMRTVREYWDGLSKKSLNLEIHKISMNGTFNENIHILVDQDWPLEL